MSGKTIELKISLDTKTADFADFLARQKGVTLEQQTRSSLANGMAIAAICFAGGEVRLRLPNGKTATITKENFLSIDQSVNK